MSDIYKVQMEVDRRRKAKAAKAAKTDGPTYEQKMERGAALVEALNLKADIRDRCKIKTARGNKNFLGLYDMVRDILDGGDK